MQQQQHTRGAFHETPTSLPLADEACMTNRHEIDLGQHHLVVLADQGIELMLHQSEQAASYALRLDSNEAYRLMRCLQDLYKPIEM